LLVQRRAWDNSSLLRKRSCLLLLLFVELFVAVKCIETRELCFEESPAEKEESLGCALSWRMLSLFVEDAERTKASLLGGVIAKWSEVYVLIPSDSHILQIKSQKRDWVVSDIFCLKLWVFILFKLCEVVICVSFSRMMMRCKWAYVMGL